MTNSISPIAAVKLLREALHWHHHIHDGTAPGTIGAALEATYRNSELFELTEAALAVEIEQPTSEAVTRTVGCDRIKVELYRATHPALPAESAVAPSHECIIREGDNLVCTTCGTTTAVQAGAPVDEREVLLRAALDIALDLANAEAADIHVRYKGYKPNAHAAADADVETVKAAISALQQPGLADKEKS